MTVRYDVIQRVKDWHYENGVGDPSPRSITFAIMADDEARKLWREKYGNTSPTGLSSRKRKMLLNDLRKAMCGQDVKGGSQGRGHRSSNSSRVEIVIVS